MFSLPLGQTSATFSILNACPQYKAIVQIVQIAELKYKSHSHRQYSGKANTRGQRAGNQGVPQRRGSELQGGVMLFVLEMRLLESNRRERMLLGTL